MESCPVLRRPLESNMRLRQCGEVDFGKVHRIIGNDLLMQKGLKVPGTCWKAQG